MLAHTERTQPWLAHTTIVSGMAGRYATALFELALESNAIDAVTSDLAKFEALITESPDLSRLVRSPVFTAEEQSRAVTALLDKAGIGGHGEQVPAARRRKPPPVRDQRHRARLQGDGSEAQGRSDRSRSRPLKNFPTRGLPKSSPRSSPLPVRTFRWTSRSTRPLSAASSSSSAAVWSTVRSAPNSMRSNLR